MEGQPEKRAGQPLAGGYFAIIYSNRGDLEWMTKQFFLRSVSSTMPCSLCNCTNYGGGLDIVPWTDVNDPPSWLETCVDDQVGGNGNATIILKVKPKLARDSFLWHCCLLAVCFPTKNEMVTTSSLQTRLSPLNHAPCRLSLISILEHILCSGLNARPVEAWVCSSQTGCTPSALEQTPAS